MNWLNRTLTAAGFAAGAYAGISGMMARGLVRPRRILPEDTPASVGLAAESVRFNCRDGNLELHGWLIPPPGQPDIRQAMNGRWVVIVHGHGTNCTDPIVGLLGLSRDLHDRGYGVFMFDMRGCGASSGERTSAGYYERLDLLGALDYLAARGARRESIGVLGFSLGGAVALMACSTPDTAAAVVADSAFADLWLMINRSQRGMSSVLSLFNPGMDLMAKVLYGIDISEVSPATSIASSETPVLIIHGEEDALVPVKHARLLARAAGSDFKEMDDEHGTLWVVPGAGHVQAYRTLHVEYVDRVSEFFSKNLAEPSAKGA